jgi:hypothetical protein
MLTLYTTPVIYLYFDELAERLAGWRRRGRGPDTSGVDTSGEPAPQP